MKNKKGFTLIELLIAVVIMISILAIAIVSVSNLSKKQKENSFERVKDEAITAATDFYYSNEYLFEEIGSNGSSYVTIGYLVENGYLNVLTDPTSNEIVPYCTRININKVDGIVHLGYDDSPASDDKTSCSNDNSFAYTNVNPENATVNLSVSLTTKNNLGGPKIYNKNSFNGWYNAEVLVDVNVKSSVNTNKVYDSSKHKLYYCTVEDGSPSCVPDQNIAITANASGINYTDDVFRDNTTDKGKTVCYRSEYKTEISQHCKIAKVDRELPTVSYEIKDKTIASTISTIPVWKQGKAEFDVSMTDAVSGINTNKYEDIAGNYGFVKIKWNNDNRKTYGTDTYLVKSEVLFTDSIGKIIPIKNGYKRIGGALESDGARHETYSVCDMAGNCTTKHIYAKLDNTAPTLKFTNKRDVYDDKTKVKWVSKQSVYFDIEVTDSLSGINKHNSLFSNNMIGSYYNEKGLLEGSSNYDTLNKIYNIAYNDSGVSAITDGYKKTDEWIEDEGARKAKYMVCDNVGNCTEKYIYANIDRTPPEIINMQSPIESSKYCGSKPSYYTQFKVVDNVKVDRIDHFMDDKSETDWYKNTAYDNIASSYPDKEVNVLISVYNGKITSDKAVFEYGRFSGAGLGTNVYNDPSSSKTGFIVSRAWKKSSDGSSIGCGTINKAVNQIPGVNISCYCNYVAAKDSAGNVAAKKFCNDKFSESQCKN